MAGGFGGRLNKHAMRLRADAFTQIMGKSHALPTTNIYIYLCIYFVFVGMCQNKSAAVARRVYHARIAIIASALLCTNSSTARRWRCRSAVTPNKKNEPKYARAAPRVHRMDFAGPQMPCGHSCRKTDGVFFSIRP